MDYRTVLCGVAALACSVGPVRASEMSCTLWSAIDPGELLETLTIKISPEGDLTVVQKVEERPSATGTTKTLKVLFHNYTTDDTLGRISVIAVESSYGPTRFDPKRYVFAPKIYVVGWGKSTLAEITIPASQDPIAQLRDHYICRRDD